MDSARKNFLTNIFKLFLDQNPDEGKNLAFLIYNKNLPSPPFPHIQYVLRNEELFKKMLQEKEEKNFEDIENFLKTNFESLNVHDDWNKRDLKNFIDLNLNQNSLPECLKKFLNVMNSKPEEEQFLKVIKIRKVKNDGSNPEKYMQQTFDEGKRFFNGLCKKFSTLRGLLTLKPDQPSNQNQDIEKSQKNKENEILEKDNSSSKRRAQKPSGDQPNKQVHNDTPILNLLKNPIENNIPSFFEEPNQANLGGISNNSGQNYSNPSEGNKNNSSFNFSTANSNENSHFKERRLSKEMKLLKIISWLKCKIKKLKKEKKSLLSEKKGAEIMNSFDTKDIDNSFSLDDEPKHKKDYSDNNNPNYICFSQPNNENNSNEYLEMNAKNEKTLSNCSKTISKQNDLLSTSDSCNSNEREDDFMNQMIKKGTAKCQSSDN